MIKQNQANTHTRTFAGCWRNRTHGFHDALVPRNGCFKHVEGHGKLSRCVGSPHSFSPHYQTFRHIILCCSHLSRHTRQIDITSTAMETENLSLCLKAGGTLIMGIHLFYNNASTSGVMLSPRSSGGKHWLGWSYIQSSGHWIPQTYMNILTLYYHPCPGLPIGVFLLDSLIESGTHFSF